MKVSIQGWFNTYGYEVRIQEWSCSYGYEVKIQEWSSYTYGYEAENSGRLTATAMK